MVKNYWAIFFGLIVIQTLPTALRAGQTAPKPTLNLIAEVRQRVETDRLDVRVYQGKKLAQLAGFMELYVVTPLPGQVQTIENLVGRSVAIIPSEKFADQLKVYVLSSLSAALSQDRRFVEVAYDAYAGQRLNIAPKLKPLLVDNIFKVKQVLISSVQRPIRIRLDEKVIQIKPGDVLLVL